MKLFNTLSKTIQDVVPLDGQTVRIYSCGPTVYDHAHIGNLSSFIFADTLRRAIAAGHNGTPQAVTHAMNFTDVDDKTIRRSAEDYKGLEPRDALGKLTQKYSDLFITDMQRVGNDVAALTFLRATDDNVIEGMRQLITELHAAGAAYIAEDGVYFSIEKYQALGKHYGQLLELNSTASQQRISNDEYDKDSVQDFALWKTQKPGEPSWPFTLAGQSLDGRPGWHIECSVMSRQALGQPFDIHTGGIDLIFPHHENEIAQSTALEDSSVMATIFAHSEHILVDGKKMAKSAKNFYTLGDITKKGYDPVAFRLLVLQSHYRNQSHFSWDNLGAAQNLLMKWYAWADLKHQPIAHNADVTATTYTNAVQAIVNALRNDVDTHSALMIVSELVTAGETQGANLDELATTLTAIDSLLGLNLSNRPTITPEQQSLIQARQQARDKKDWTAADAARDALADSGIGVRDTDKGTVWFRQ